MDVGILHSLMALILLGDEPQFWYNLGSFWPTLLAQTIHLYFLMHAFLSLFMLFVGGRLDTLSTRLMHYDPRFWH